MRFIRQEEVIRTIFNDNVKDNDIAPLLNVLMKDNTYVSVSFKRYGIGLNVSNVFSYNKAIIKNVDDEKRTCDFRVYNNRSVINLSNISFDDILEISVITNKVDLYSARKKNIFDFIEIDI